MTYNENGLTEDEVSKRIAEGKVNGSSNIKTKSIKQIIKDNTLTFFNFLNIALAVLVLTFGHIKNAMFIGVILCNTAIGIIQEIRAKKTIDRLTLIAAPKAHVIRGGNEKEIPTDEIVIDDLIVFRTGMQAAADCEVISGECEVNESLITGESDPVFKKQGEKILSGSFIVSGEVRAVACGIGSDSFANKITSGAKYVKKNESKMMNSINKVLKVISICILPIMAILLFDGLVNDSETLNHAIVSTVAAIIGMIPEGLVLLTSIVLAVSSIRLAQNKTLVQDLYCIETLARVDTLCLDKTGTITEGSMAVDEVKLLDCNDDDVNCAMTALANALSDGNPTFNAVKEKWNGESDWNTVKSLPFSSAKKWSGAQFDNKGTYIMGAGEFILGEKYEEIRNDVDSFSTGGRRVILLAHSDNPFNDKSLPDNVKPLALIAITDKIRKEAPETLRYFDEQGVEIKIISGDNPVTVSAVALKAGVKNAEKYIDASTVENIGEVVDDYTVFGRVTPAQKLELVKALKAKGHTVGMTGDGVNDVLALKEADCSIAMQSGSEAARNVSNLVLLDSNFASMPKVVYEGRRSINNVERSASLFLSKTVYSSLLAVIFAIIQIPFIFEPIQMTLINAICIGIPSFLLALQSNKEIIRGSFISNVMQKAIPNGITAVLALMAGVICANVFNFKTNSPDQLGTISVVILAVVSFMIMILSCKPIKIWKIGMVVGLIIVFTAGSVIFSGFLELCEFSPKMIDCTVIISIASIVCILLLNMISHFIVKAFAKRKIRRA